MHNFSPNDTLKICHARWSYNLDLAFFSMRDYRQNLQIVFFFGWQETIEFSMIFLRWFLQNFNFNTQFNEIESNETFSNLKWKYKMHELESVWRISVGPKESNKKTMWGIIYLSAKDMEKKNGEKNQTLWNGIKRQTNTHANTTFWNKMKKYAGWTG